MSSARARRAASRRARVDDSMSPPVPPSLQDDDHGKQDKSAPQQEGSSQARRSTRKRRAAPPPPLTRPSRKGKRSKTSWPRDDQRISSLDEVGRSPGEGSETNSQERDDDSQRRQSLGSASAHSIAEAENDTEPHESESARRTELSKPVGGEGGEQTVKTKEKLDTFAAKNISKGEAPVRPMPASTETDKSAGKESFGTTDSNTVEENIKCVAAPRALRSAVPVTSGGSGQPSRPLKDATDETATAALSPTKDSVAVPSLKESKPSESVLTSAPTSDITDNLMQKAPTAFLQPSQPTTSTAGSLHGNERAVTPAPSFLTSAAVEAAAGLAELLASSSGAPSDSKTKSILIDVPHVLNIDKLENAAVDSGANSRSGLPVVGPSTVEPSAGFEAKPWKDSMTEKIKQATTCSPGFATLPVRHPGEITVVTGPTSSRPLETETDSGPRSAPLSRDVKSSAHVDLELGTESRKRPLSPDVTATETRGKGNYVAEPSKKARLHSGISTETVVNADRTVSATSGADTASHFNSPTVEQIRVRLFEACLSSHKGMGASRMFASYWDTISRYVCHDIAGGNRPGASSLQDASVVLDSFLVTKQMRKLHNMLIMALLARCTKLESNDPRIQDSVPGPWRRRLRVVRDEVPAAPSTSAALTTSQPLRFLVPPVNLSVQSDFGLSSGVWVAGGLCGYTAFDRAHDKTSGQGLQIPSIACQTPSSLPGALIVDPTIRRIIEEYDGLKVSENAIWLLIIAVRQYVRTVLEKTVRQTEFIREKTLPQMSLSRAALLAGKTVPGPVRGAPQDTTMSRKPTSEEKYVISPLDIALQLSSAPTAFRGSISGSASRLAYERSVQSSFSPAFPPSPAAVRPLHNFLLKAMWEKIGTIDAIARKDFRAGLQDASWSPHPVPSPRPVNGSQQYRTLSGGLGRGAKDLAALKARAEAAAKEAAVDPAIASGERSPAGSGQPGGATPLTSRSSTPVTTNTTATKAFERHVQSQGGDVNASSKEAHGALMRPPTTTVAQIGQMHAVDSSGGQGAQLAGVPPGAFRQQGNVPLYTGPLAPWGRGMNPSTSMQHAAFPQTLARGLVDIAPAPPFAPPANVGAPQPAANAGASQLITGQAMASQPSLSGTDSVVQNGAAPHQQSAIGIGPASSASSSGPIPGRGVGSTQATDGKNALPTLPASVNNGTAS